MYYLVMRELACDSYMQDTPFLFRCCVVVGYRKRLQARDEPLAVPCCTFNGNGRGRAILTEERTVVSGLGEVQCEVYVTCYFCGVGFEEES
jgi:hypothetical protein